MTTDLFRPPDATLDTADRSLDLDRYATYAPQLETNGRTLRIVEVWR